MDYTTATLEALRFEGDPLADAVIQAVVDAGQLEDVNHLLRHLQTNDQPIPDELPIVVQEYLRATDQPPAWIDFDRIAGCHTFSWTTACRSALCCPRRRWCNVTPRTAR